MQCTLSKGYVRAHSPNKGDKKTDPTWLKEGVVNFSFCGQTAEYWMDAKINGKNVVVPAGADSGQYKNWLKWVQQWWALTFSLERFDCSEPKPTAVAIQYAAATAWILDHANCFVPSENASTDQTMFDDWNNGLYAELGGPIHCDECPCECWDYADAPSAHSDCNCTSCEDDASGAKRRRRSTVDEVAASSSSGQRLNPGDNYHVSCCINDPPTIASDDQQLLDAHLCDGTSLHEALMSPDYNAKNYELAAATVNAKQCVLAPVLVQHAYERLLALDDRRCDGEDVSNSDFNYFLESVLAYNNGSFGLRGGPCLCSDAECLALQAQYRPHVVSSLAEIVSHKTSSSSGDEDALSGGAIAGIVATGVTIMAVFVALVVLITALSVYVARRRDIRSAEHVILRGDPSDDGRDY